MVTHLKALRNMLALSFLISLMTGCGGTFCSDCPIVDVQALEVSRAENVSFSEDGADEILEIASLNLKTQNNDVDVACDLTLQRKGALQTFSNTRSVDTLFQLLNVGLSTPGYVKIVSEINYCSELNPSIVGCAPTPGNYVIVEPYKTGIGAILWTHEFGHSQSLPHREGIRTLMNPYLAVEGDVVNEKECTALRRQRSITTPLRVALYNLYKDLTEPTESAPQSVAPEALSSIEEFVRNIHVTGIPYDKATRFDESAIPTLTDLLSNPADEPFKVNIVVMLGMLGNSDTLGVLTDFISQHQGELSADNYRSVTAAVISIGYLANRDDGAAALAYLIDGLQTEKWNQRVLWSSPFHKDDLARNERLVETSVLGLALSGKQEALDAIGSLSLSKARAQAVSDSSTDSFFSDVIDIGVSIQSKGLSGYYAETGH